jgi:hypothetical protein
MHHFSSSSTRLAHIYDTNRFLVGNRRGARSQENIMPSTSHSEPTSSNSPALNLPESDTVARDWDGTTEVVAKAVGAGFIMAAFLNEVERYMQLTHCSSGSRGRNTRQAVTFSRLGDIGQSGEWAALAQQAGVPQQDSPGGTNPPGLAYLSDILTRSGSPRC